MLGEQRPAEPAALPQRQRGTAAGDAGDDHSPGELLPVGCEVLPAESLLRVLDGLKRL